jgi:two-component system, OmpR family, sensor histidine kinase BaeS
MGCVGVITVTGIAALAVLFSHTLGTGRSTVLLVTLGSAALALILPILAVSLAIRTFRGIALPLADVMVAADRVAAGDLSVRVGVPTHGPADFRRLAESFNRMTEELERADRRRRNLTADVAHELRTPLHIIQGNLEGVLDQVYQPTADHIRATLDETRLLARLVEDLRTLSLAEAGQLPMVKEPVDVRDLLADVETGFRPQAEAGGIELRVASAAENSGAAPPQADLHVSADAVASDVASAHAGDSPPPPLVVTGDVDRLGQVLGNLVSNALRHTPASGTVTLRAEPAPAGVRLTVSDTGPGIAAEDLPYIFDRFWRGDRSRSHAGGAGSGLGLAIARQLIQAHGGTIRAESRSGHGAAFIIDLPTN